MYTIHGEKCSSVSATVGQYYLYYTVSGGEARKKKRGKKEKNTFPCGLPEKAGRIHAVAATATTTATTQRKNKFRLALCRR